MAQRYMNGSPLTCEIARNLGRFPRPFTCPAMPLKSRGLGQSPRKSIFHPLILSKSQKNKNLAGNSVLKGSTSDVATKLKKVHDEARLVRDQVVSTKTTVAPAKKLENHAPLVENQNEDNPLLTAHPTVEEQKQNYVENLVTAENADNTTKPDEIDSGKSISKSNTPELSEPKLVDNNVPKTILLTGTWKNAGGVQVKMTDDGNSIKLQVGETQNLVSLNGSLTRTEKADVFEGTVQIIPKADRRHTPLNIPVKATLLNPDELQLTYTRWPTFNRNGIRQSADTRSVDNIKRN